MTYTRTGMPRGFATMKPEKRREIASKGGKRAHEVGKAHKFTPEEAQQAGRKGGLVRGLRGLGHMTPKVEQEA